MKSFPVLWPVERKKRQQLETLGCPRSVPWNFVETGRKQAYTTHDQTLERLAERGGLSPRELVAVVTGRDFHWVFIGNDVDAVPELLQLLAGNRDPKENETQA